MAASIKGRQVVWGVTAGAIAAVQAATGSGIVQSFTPATGGETELIKDEDADVVTRIDHGAVNSFDFEILAEPDSEVPLKGQEITGVGTIDGINFSVGRVFVDEATPVYGNTAVKKITGKCSHYPNMPADS